MQIIKLSISFNGYKALISRDQLSEQFTKRFKKLIFYILKGLIFENLNIRLWQTYMAPPH